MSPAGLLILTLLAGWSMAAVATDDLVHEVISGLNSCLMLSEDSPRLACYDRLAKENAPPDYSGKLGFRTQPFDLDRPHRVRFRSQGVVFVLYVLDANGSVVQNLHLGGGGEDSYVIETPGRYSLQIAGSARWKIWIEPMSDEPIPE